MAQVPPQQWPTVDVYIPTYNEDVDIVRKTVLATMATEGDRGTGLFFAWMAAAGKISTRMLRPGAMLSPAI